MEALDRYDYLASRIPGAVLLQEQINIVFTQIIYIVILALLALVYYISKRKISQYKIFDLLYN